LDFAKQSHGVAAAWAGWPDGPPESLVGWATIQLAPPIIGLFVR